MRFLTLCIACPALALCACVDDPERFDRPTNVAFASNGDVYVADGYNHARIAKFSSSGRFVSEFGERGFGEGQFNTPHGIAIDDAGRIYVADRDNGRIQVFSADGAFLDQWKSAELGRPWAVTYSDDGYLYVVDGGDQDPKNPRGHVLKLDRTGKIVARWSSFGDTPGKINWGHGVAVGKDGSVYVVDVEGRRVQKFRAKQ